MSTYEKQESWTENMGMQYLVADVGGTNTRVAMASAGVLQTESVQLYHNADKSGVTQILQDYMRNHAPKKTPFKMPCAPMRATDFRLLRHEYKEKPCAVNLFFT